MARKARSRVLSDSCFTHVFSRAIEKRWIFQEGGDFQKFLGLLLESKKTADFLIHHYCLMNTHFHMVLRLGMLTEFSKSLQWVKWQYTHYYNLKYKRYGPLWRERFSSLLIEDERYLAACGQYVEFNPVEAGMVKRCEEWPYSSGRCYSLGEEDPLVDRYAFDGSLPEGVDFTSKAFFERGSGIGSALFKFCLKEGIQQPCLSPKK